MVQTDRFLLREPQLHQFLQPECPVYVHCTRQSEERRSEALFLQLRLVNCGESAIETVVFDAEGLNASGECCYVLRCLVMAKCNAAPKEIFGEDRVFALQRQRVQSFRITVRQVVFANGMSWKMLPQHSIVPLDAAQWQMCSCGMPNPPQKEICGHCGASLLPEEEPAAEISLSMESETPMVERPAPIVRRESPAIVNASEAWADEDDEEDEDDEGIPVWLSVLLCIFGALAILAVLAFAAFFLHEYIL